MSIYLFICFLFIQALAGFIVGSTSFGGNLFAIPLMTALMPVRDAILIACLSTCAIFIMSSVVYRKYLIWPDICIMGISGIAGAPVGTWLLVHANLRFLLIASGITIAIFLLWQSLLPRLGKKERLISRLYAWPCGFMGGLMAGMVGMGGPPVVFYTYMRHWKKESAIGGISAVCLFQLAMIIYAQWQQALYTEEIIRLSIWASAASSLGFLISMPLVRHMNIGFFRSLVLSVLALSSITLIIKGFFS